MIRYCSFFDINNKPDNVRISLEKEKMKVYYDLKTQQWVCHEVLHQHIRKKIPTELDIAFKQAIKDYDKDTGRSKFQTLTNKDRDTKFEAIKDILKKQREKDDTFVDALCKMPFYDIDEYVEYKKCNELHSEKARRKRFLRKCGYNRHAINYWATFTIDPKKFSSEEEGIEKLFRWFSNNSFRYGLKVMGGVESGDKNGHLHIHCVLIVPDDFFKDGELKKVSRYSEVKKQWRNVWESVELREKFGINEFEEFKGMTDNDISTILNYVSTYATKEGGRMYYSRGIPDCVYQYVDSDELFFEIEDGQMKYYAKDGFVPGKDSLLVMLRNGKIKAGEFHDMPFKEKIA